MGVQRKGTPRAGVGASQEGGDSQPEFERGQSLPAKVVRAFMTEWPGQRGNKDIPEKHSKDTHS